MNVLIVEDDVFTAESISEIVRKREYNSETVRTGKEAMERIKQKRFDLAFLDIFLPDCKGYELIPQFREHWPGIGILAMTGHNSRELELKVRSFKINYYMIKPFGIEEVEEVLNHISKRIVKEMKAV